eukprot:3588204-Amphidinium_carterae.2
MGLALKNKDRPWEVYSSVCPAHMAMVQRSAFDLSPRRASAEKILDDCVSLTCACMSERPCVSVGSRVTRASKVERIATAFIAFICVIWDD